MVGRLPTVTGSPASGRLGTATATDLPFASSNVRAALDPVGPRRRVSIARHTSTFSKRSGVPGSNFARICATAVPSIARDLPARSNSCGRLPRPPGPPKSPGSRGRPAAHRIPDPRRHRPAVARRVCSRRKQHEVRLAEPAEHLADHRAQLAGVEAASARGRSSVLTAFQSTPFIRGSKCVSRTIFHAASNVSTGAWPCAATEQRRERTSDARDDRATLHFKSALIAAGASNVAGSTCVVLDRRERDHLLQAHGRLLERRRPRSDPNFL